MAESDAQQSFDAIPPQDDPDSKRPEGEAGLPVVSQPTPPPEHKSETHTCRPDQTPLWKKILEVGALALGITLAWIYWHQLQTMNDQLEEMQKSRKQTDQLLRLNRKQLEQSSIEATAAQAQTANAEKFFRQDERAWVELDLKEMKPVEMPKSMDTPPVFEVFAALKNYGKTSAINLRAKANTRYENGAVVTKKMVLNDFLIHLIPERVPNVLAPGDETQLTSVRALLGTPNTAFGYRLTSDFVGRIDYDDTFGEHHWVTFCYQLSSDHMLIACEYGNDEDHQGEKPTSQNKH